MIRVVNLNKVYKSKKEEVNALNNVNLTFPNKGFVFITGKSGSGKSTLLNIIGALDKSTSGEVYFNDFNVTSANENELSEYRNEFIGFIFQDFCLIENMSVYDNIAVSLEMKGRKDDFHNEILQIIKDLDLKGLENRKVCKLSAGQKQRVSVARAVIKKPMVILADEPTGNLDKNSGKKVLDYLKKVSKEILVIVISHNLNDAYTYGDNVVILSHGEVIKNLVSTNDDKFVIDNKMLYAGNLYELNDDEFDAINNSLKTHDFEKIASKSQLFFENNNEINDRGTNVKFEKERMNAKKILKLFRNLLGNNLTRTILFSFFSMVIICITCLCFMLRFFDSDTVLIDQTFTQLIPAYNLRKAVKSGEPNYSVTYTIPKKVSGSENEILNKSENREIYTFSNFGWPYINGSYCYYATSDYLYSNVSEGTMKVTKEDLKKLLNVDELEITEASKYEEGGIYITDFTADCISYINKVNYENILGQNIDSFTLFNSFYINGIIKTNYKEDYKELIESAKNNNYNLAMLAEAYEDEIRSFYTECQSYLAYNYTFEDDFCNKFVNSKTCMLFGSRNLSVIIEGYENREYYFANKTILSSEFYSEPNITGDNQMLLSLSELNSIVGESFTLEEANDFLNGKNITLHIVDSYGNQHSFNVNLVIQEEVAIQTFSDNILREMLRSVIYKCGASYNEESDCANAYKALKKEGYSVSSLTYTTASRLVEIIVAYKDLFEFIGIILLVAGVFVILVMSYDSVRKKIYEIGVLKGIGMKITDLYKVYGLNMLMEFLICLIFYIPLIFIFKDVANIILLDTIKYALTAITNIPSFDVFIVTPSIVFASIGVIICSLILGLIIPMLKIKYIKPINIIKSKY